MIALFFVGDFGWVRHLGVAADNRGIAFHVFLYMEKGIFFHILSYIFDIECQIPVDHCNKCKSQFKDTMPFFVFFYYS